MPTSGAVLAASFNGGKNLVSSIKNIGVDANKAMSARSQQSEIVLKHLQAMPKGENLSVTIENTTNAAKSFILFDYLGLAEANGVTNNNNVLTFTTTFAGNASYTALKSYISGSRMASVGTSFEFSDEAIINTSGIKVWNGNIEDYNGKTLQNLLQLAKDTYANDQKVLVLSTTLWVNQFLAINGTLPAGGSLTIVFNICGHGNF